MSTQREEFFRAGIHRIMCGYYEPILEGPKKGRVRERPEFRPEMGSEDCICGHVKCPPEPVPASTAIRTSRVGNIDKGRLIVRLEFLRGHVRRAGVWAEQKADFKARVREIVAIEREMHARGMRFIPVSDGAHLAHEGA